MGAVLSPLFLPQLGGGGGGGILPAGFVAEVGGAGVVGRREKEGLLGED